MNIVGWLASDKGVDTLEFVGTLLVSPEILALVLGKERTERLGKRLTLLSERLSPSRIRALARDITIGPIGRIVLCALLIAGVAAVVFDLVEIIRAFRLSVAPASSRSAGLATYLLRTTQVDLNKNGAIGLWLIKVSLATLPLPMCCFGGAVGVWVTRSSTTQSRFNSLIEMLSAVIFKEQMRIGPPGSLFVALVGTIALVTFAAGIIAGNLILLLSFGVVEKALRGLGFVVDRSRLRRGAAVAGFTMWMTAYLIKIFR